MKRKNDDYTHKIASDNDLSMVGQFMLMLFTRCGVQIKDLTCWRSTNKDKTKQMAWCEIAFKNGSIFKISLEYCNNLLEVVQYVTDELVDAGVVEDGKLFY